MFLDSSIIYNALVETDLTKYARTAMELPVPKITSDTAIDETWFALTKKALRVESARGVKKALHSSKDARNIQEEVLAKILAFLGKHAISIIPDSRNWAKIAQTASKYGLLPHDARLLVTALEAGATTFATLDTDFQVVAGDIELLPREYWKEKV